MKTKSKQFGFTLVEMITVITIIVVLIGLSVPTLSWVRRIAKETKQKVQISTISFALETFKNDYGSYPPSNGWDYASMSGLDYCGTQKLAEALLGFDLMGFHPNSYFVSDGGGVYSNVEANLRIRKGPYLKFASTNVFKLGDLFDDTNILEADTFVICNSFGISKRRITLNGKTVVPGTPILYYRANVSSKRLQENPLKGDGIYDFRDNNFLIGLGKIGDVMMTHPLLNLDIFYGVPTDDPPKIGYIQDPKITALPWPYRPDSYILISAGVDGLYGTGDDITNFGN